MAVEAPSEPEIADPGDAAVGTVYNVLARLFEEPTAALFDALDEGTLQTELEAYLETAGFDEAVTVPDLSPEDDRDLLAARFNDIFVVGYPEPPVPLYESAYYSESQWEGVNVDLARAYEFFGVSIDEEEREHHDHLVIELEFAGYLARLAAIEDREDVRNARRDFLDRHLQEFAENLQSAIEDEPETGIYDDLVAFFLEFVEADRRGLNTSETAEVASP